MHPDPCTDEKLHSPESLKVVQLITVQDFRQTFCMLEHVYSNIYKPFDLVTGFIVICCSMSTDQLTLVICCK